MNASHIHIILITLIIISLSFELYYMSQAETAKTALVTKLGTTATGLSSLVSNIGTSITSIF